MKLSVVIPAHNEEQYIGATLTAVLAQKYPDLEVIVVDNNSTDGTREVVKTQFPSVILLEEHGKGPQFARERGRQAATGELLANLDADCMPLPNWASTAAAYFKDPKIVAVTGPYDYYDAPWFLHLGTAFTQKVIYNCFYRFVYFFFRRGVGIVGGNVIMRASAIAKAGGYNTAIVFYGDDTDTARRLASVGRVIFRNDVIVRSSARRFAKIGIFATIRKYFLNYMWVMLFNKPYQNKEDTIT